MRNSEGFFLSKQKSSPYQFDNKKNNLRIQWDLSKADTYGTEIFVRFREVSALERFELKSSKFKVRLFYTGPTLTRTPPPPYLTMGMWNGEKEVIFFVMYQFILHQRLK